MYYIWWLFCFQFFFFFFSSRRRHTRYWRDWNSDVCSSDLPCPASARAIWVLRYVTTRSGLRATAAFSRCLSTTCCSGMDGGKEINFSPLSADQEVVTRADW